MDKNYFCHQSTGWVQFDPLKGTKHFDAWWALLICSEEIPRYYSWFALKYGVSIQTGSRWRTHISFIKGEKPQRMPYWGRSKGEKVEFHYTNNIRWDNGKHAWLDVYCPRLSEIRTELGLKPKETYHLTIGRLDTEKEYTPHKYDQPRPNRGAPRRRRSKRS